jgi:uroporphyrinogen-III synthase
MAYDLKAQEYAYSFFARGVSKERAVREIRKVYGGFSSSTWDEWVAKLDWRERRAEADIKLREFEDLAQNTAKVLLLELDRIRQRLFKEVEEKGPDTQAVYAYTSVAKQIADISRQHLANRDGGRLALEVLNAAFERFLTELREDPELAKILAAKATLIGRTVEKVAEEFGAA